jgi:hypothetical protein
MNKRKSNFQTLFNLCLVRIELHHIDAYLFVPSLLNYVELKEIAYRKNTEFSFFYYLYKISVYIYLLLKSQVLEGESSLSSQYPCGFPSFNVETCLL